MYIFLVLSDVKSLWQQHRGKFGSQSHVRARKRTTGTTSYTHLFIYFLTKITMTIYSVAPLQ